VVQIWPGQTVTFYTQIVSVIFEPHCIIILAFTTHLRVLAYSFLTLHDHTKGRTTVGRTPLEEWSARRRDLYLTHTQHSQHTNIHALGGIRTRNPSRRATADPRLRPLGHWDRLSRRYNFTYWKF
jgi:hypothetical protein